MTHGVLSAMDEAFGPLSGPANGIEKMVSARQEPAADVSVTWSDLFLASLASIWAARAQAFLRCAFTRRSQTAFDDACMADVSLDMPICMVPAACHASCLCFACCWSDSRIEVTD